MLHRSVQLAAPASAHRACLCRGLFPLADVFRDFSCVARTRSLFLGQGKCFEDYMNSVAGQNEHLAWCDYITQQVDIEQRLIARRQQEGQD